MTIADVWFPPELIEVVASEITLYSQNSFWGFEERHRSCLEISKIYR